MKILLQRVLKASVTVNSAIVGEINAGLLAFVGISKTDDKISANKALEKLLNFRIFEDSDGKMNNSLVDENKGLLLVPQFTLVADTNSGRRPSFATAASPDESQKLFNYFVEQAKSRHEITATGEFGANMQVSLINDGPVTFMLEN